ncbi:MAG: SufE family protein [Opitutaceae bacterium]|nr:SufE family protein [Opitutaceae bacterium]
MSVSEKQAQLIEDLSFIEDRQERLAAVVDRARRRPAFPAVSKTDAHRVVGCISQVWVTGELRDGALHFAFDADSPLVKGLVALLIDLYEGGTPADIVATEPVLFETLGIKRDLTPTRQNGLIAVRAQIKKIAAGF